MHSVDQYILRMTSQWFYSWINKLQLMVVVKHFILALKIV